MENKVKFLVSLVLIFTIGLTACREAKNTQDGNKTFHMVEINHRVFQPEEGLIIGNGELSVSIYQTVDKIVWRFGKNDVWDRRHDTSHDPEPAHINEIAKGIMEEGWVNNSFNQSIVKTRDGKPASKRVQEICDGTPSYATRPYPCPKPVGELALHLPMDQKLVSISQVLTIEQDIVTIDLDFESGVSVRLESFVPPESDLLVVNWKLENWNDVTATGFRPSAFSLYRWADPQIADFAKKWLANTGNSTFMRWADPDLNPLPPPETGMIDSVSMITQRFYPDFDSEQGFRCVMLPVAPGCQINAVNSDWKKEARLHIFPENKTDSGSMAVAIVTGNKPEEVDNQCLGILAMLDDGYSSTIQTLRQETMEAANEFWERSEVATADSLFNTVWYETMHAIRCTHTPDHIAPGLYLPSTLNDYSAWHGDYHTNYNYQSNFWGRYEANQVDLGDAFFPGMKYMVELGRKLAKKYWDSRGTFIQLAGYPFTLEKDPLGVGSLCRMAYMTGWVSNHYWYRYLYTMDKIWLRDEGYPVIKDAALFYTDFLEQGKDGKYHAFPSGEGEYHFTGDEKDYTDKPQVIRHARYTLQIAAEAAAALDTDQLLREQWFEIVENIADVDSLAARGFNGEEKRRYLANSPEFILMPEVLEASGAGPDCLKQTLDNPLWSWYFGQLPWALTGQIRNGNFVADRDYPVLSEFLSRWRMPNGLFRGMSQNAYSYMGAMSECLGILGPMSEMLIQSWDNGISVFPAWPKSVDASFRQLRARGAFLVSSQLQDRKVQYIKIASEQGGDCTIVNPWNAKKLRVIRNGEESKIDVDTRFSLNTSKNDIIIIKP